MVLFGILAVVLVWVLIFAAIVYAIDQVAAFAPYKGVARAILAIMLVVLLIGLLIGTIPIPGHFLR